MASYVCTICGYVYDEDLEGTPWGDLPDNYICPVCQAIKSYFEPVQAPESDRNENKSGKLTDGLSFDDFRRTNDKIETYMDDIHAMAETGRSIIEPMRTPKTVISWDDILIKGAQLSRIPLNHDDPVNTKTVIGPNAKQPMEIDMPIYVSHMSFGALSKEVKTAMAMGSAAVKTAICSGEGGILEDEFDNAYKYIFEYVPNKYSLTDENLKKVSAVEIKIGQSAKPGMGGHLPAEKVTEEIARIRNLPVGMDIISPANYDDIRTAKDLKSKIDWLRGKTDGKPIGVKIAAGHIEEDLKIILHAQPDFITIDGRPGGTGASPRHIKAATSIPTIFALYRARKFLDENKANHISLVITGGLRVSSDFAKALALGADAVAIASAAMIACGCQQYRVCHSGNCPVGIATQDKNLRKRLDIGQSAQWLANYLAVCNNELADFARLTGNDDIHKLAIEDLCTVNSEISSSTDIKHV